MPCELPDRQNPKLSVFASFLAAVIVLTGLALPNSAHALGRGPSQVAFSFQISVVDVASVAQRYLGFGKFTRLPGAWCADAVSVWLTATGKPPLPSRMAGAAFVYGQRVATPRRNDLFVIGRGRHVGIVLEDLGRSVRVISGNWGRHVRVAVLSKAGLTFIRP